MAKIPFFLTNPKWYRYEENVTNDGTAFQRFELTNKAPEQAIDSFKQTMLDIGADNHIDPNNLNRFQQALGFAMRQHLFHESHGLNSVQIADELHFMSCAIRSYQLLNDTLTAPNTLIFRKRIATLYRQYLKQHQTRINDPELTNWIIAQDNKI